MFIDRLGARSSAPGFVHKACALLAIAVFVSATPVHAQPEAPAKTSTMLITLGTQGGPLPSKTRAQPANLVVANGQPYLIDAGDGVIRQLTLAGIPFMRINQIFITHHHDDHNAGLSALMGRAWSLGRPQPVDIFGPVGTKALVSGFLEAFKPNRDIRMADFTDFYKIMPEQMFRVHETGSAARIFEDGNVQVDALENCHFHFDPERSAPASMRSYALRFKTADRTIVFSGDTGPCERLVEFARGADILVHEVIQLNLIEAAIKATGDRTPEQLQRVLRHMEEDHTTPEEVGKLAARAGVGMVVLTHIVPGSESDPDDAYTAGVAKHYRGKVVLARDLMRF